MRDMPYILTDACDATCAGIETVLRNEAARREAGQELPEDIRRQLWDAVRERVREMNPVDGDADQNGEGEGEGNENGDENGEGDENGNGNPLDDPEGLHEEMTQFPQIVRFVYTESGAYLLKKMESMMSEYDVRVVSGGEE